MRRTHLLLRDMLDSIAEVVDSTPASAEEFEDNKFIQSHVLFAVNWDRVFKTARDDIPILRSQIQAILASFPTQPEEPE